MKLSLVNNAELIIEANLNKAGDVEMMNKVAEEIAKDSGIDIAAGDDVEGWIHLCACWANFQAEDLKHAYQVAKKKLTQ